MARTAEDLARLRNDVRFGVRGVEALTPADAIAYDLDRGAVKFEQLNDAGRSLVTSEWPHLAPAPTLTDRGASLLSGAADMAAPVTAAVADAAKATGEYLSRIPRVVTEGIPAAGRAFMERTAPTAPTFGQELRRRGTQTEPVFGGPPKAPTFTEQVLFGGLSPIPGALDLGERVMRMFSGVQGAGAELGPEKGKPLTEAFVGAALGMPPRAALGALAQDVRNVVRSPRLPPPPKPPLALPAPQTGFEAVPQPIPQSGFVPGEPIGLPRRGEVRPRALPSPLPEVPSRVLGPRPARPFETAPPAAPRAPYGVVLDQEGRVITAMERPPEPGVVKARGIPADLDVVTPGGVRARVEALRPTEAPTAAQVAARRAGAEAPAREKLLYQGVRPGSDPDNPSYWFTDSFDEAKMWAQSQQGDKPVVGAGHIVVVRERDILSYADSVGPSGRKDFPNSTHYYTGGSTGGQKARPVIKTLDLNGNEIPSPPTLGEQYAAAKASVTGPPRPVVVPPSRQMPKALPPATRRPFREGAIMVPESSAGGTGRPYTPPEPPPVPQPGGSPTPAPPAPARVAAAGQSVPAPGAPTLPPPAPTLSPSLPRAPRPQRPVRATAGPGVDVGTVNLSDPDEVLALARGRRGINFGPALQGEAKAVPFFFRNNRTGIAWDELVDEIAAAQSMRPKDVERRLLATMERYNDLRRQKRLRASEPPPVPEIAEGPPALPRTAPDVPASVETPPPAPRFERTAIGDQALIPGAEGRQMPTTKLRPTTRQTDIDETPLFGQERAAREAEMARAQGSLLEPPQLPRAPLPDELVGVLEPGEWAAASPAEQNRILEMFRAMASGASDEPGSAGKVTREALMRMLSTGSGAVIGGTQGETERERWRNALIGAAAGLVAPTVFGAARRFGERGAIGGNEPPPAPRRPGEPPPVPPAFRRETVGTPASASARATGAPQATAANVSQATAQGRQVIAAAQRQATTTPPPQASATAAVREATEGEIVELFGNEPPRMTRVREALGQGLVPNYRYAEEAVALLRERRGAQALLAEQARRGQRQILGEASTAGVTPEEVGLSLKGLGQNPEAAAIIRPWRERIDRNSAELVRQGLLDEKTAATNLSSYARRVYLRDILGRDYVPIPEVVDRARGFLAENLVIDGRAASAAEIEATIQRLLRPQSRTVLTLRGRPRIDTSPTLRRQNIPPVIRELMGEVEDGAYLAARTLMDQESMLINAQFFRAFAQGAEETATAAGQRVRVPWSRTTPAPGYTAVPDAPTYGALRGQYVLDRYAPEIVAMERLEPANLAEKIYFGFLNEFKRARTVLNPATHVRNIVGNFAFADFAEIAPWDPRNAMHYRRAFAALARGVDDPLFAEAMKHGAVGVEFTGPDVRLLASTLLDTSKRAGTLAALREAAFRKIDGVGRLYNAEDMAFKLAAYSKQRAAGATPTQASAHVNTWFPNYSEVGPWVRALRGTERSHAGALAAAIGNPFASYKAEAVRIGFQAARQHPVKLAKWLVLPQLITRAGMAAMGVDPEDARAAFRRLPGFLQQPYTSLVPWRDAAGNLQFFDMTYFHFLGDLIAANPRTSGLERLLGSDNPATATAGALAQSFVGGSPFVGTVLQLASNTDFFSGRSITEFPVTTFEGASDVGGFLAREALPIPPLLMNLPPALGRAIEGHPGRLGQRQTPGEVLTEQILGLRTVPVDADLRRRGAVQLQGRLNELNRRLYGAAREPNRARRDARMRALLRERDALLRRQRETTAEYVAVPSVPR